MDMPGFREQVYNLISEVPRGRVVTYGQVAALCGSPRAARIVGSLAHFGPPELPWHRLVNKKGGLAAGYYGGRSAQKARLEDEGIQVDEDFRVDVERLIWYPES